MSRIFIVPEKLPIINSLNDEPTGSFMEFREFVRILFLRERILEITDIFTLTDLRDSLKNCKHEDVVELNEQNWMLLCSLAKNPIALQSQFFPSLVGFSRVITEAKVK